MAVALGIITNYNYLLVAGVQRKLELDHQVNMNSCQAPEGNHKLTKAEAMNQPWSRPPPAAAAVRSNGECCFKQTMGVFRSRDVKFWCVTSSII